VQLGHSLMYRHVQVYQRQSLYSSLAVVFVICVFLYVISGNNILFKYCMNFLRRIVVWLIEEKFICTVTKTFFIIQIN